MAEQIDLIENENEWEIAEVKSCQIFFPFHFQVNDHLLI